MPQTIETSDSNQLILATIPNLGQAPSWVNYCSALLSYPPLLDVELLVRIIYWNNSCLEPEIEAISKEVFQLARHFSPSWLFGVNPHYQFRFSLRERYVGFHPSFDLLLRLLIPLVESYADINHVYGEPCPWIFSKTVMRRPIILSIVSERAMGTLNFLNDVGRSLSKPTPIGENFWGGALRRTK